MTAAIPGEHADFRALRAPVHSGDLRRFREEARIASPDLHVSFWTAARSTLVMVFVALTSLLLCLFTLTLLTLPATLLLPYNRQNIPGVAGKTALGLAIAIVAAAMTFWACRMMVDAFRRDARFKVKWRRTYRLWRFALDNGLVYQAEIHNPMRSGTIFDAGHKRRASDVLSMPDGADFEIGNYQYGGIWMSERALRRFGYLRIRLPRALPHIVLEARRNVRVFGRSNLPWRFRASQVLSLEGNFDRYFTLHAPVGYEHDALYLFTPDLMILLRDRASHYDVEIVDDWMYVYSPRYFRMLNPRTYERVFKLLETVGRKTFDRAGRYSDDRTPAGTVNPYGRRLRRRVLIGPLIFLGIYTAIIIVRVVLVTFNA